MSVNKFSCLKISSCFTLVTVAKNEMVAFSVSPRHRRVYRSNADVIFDSVSLNVGNHYDTSANQFVCPYNGIYGISLALNSDVDCVMMKQSDVVARVNTKQAGDNCACGHASTFVVCECLAGERIYVKTRRGGPTADVQESGILFAGFLIQTLV